MAGVKQDRLDILCEVQTPMDMGFDVVVQVVLLCSVGERSEPVESSGMDDFLRLEHAVGETESCSVHHVGAKPQMSGAESW